MVRLVTINLLLRSLQRAPYSKSYMNKRNSSGPSRPTEPRGTPDFSHLSEEREEPNLILKDRLDSQLMVQQRTASLIDYDVNNFVASLRRGTESKALVMFSETTGVP